MTRLKCTVAYDGHNYCGWQSQLHNDSVQEQIESALSVICNEKVNITASGRTDAKVNAWGQVFHFDTDKQMSMRKWMGAINGFLPDDIHIRRVEEADSFFHARYCVREKQYDYNINFGEYNVFEKDHVYQCPYKADIEKMKEASRYLVGKHDFTSFNSTPLKETPDQVRTVYSIEFRENQDHLTISYRGHGFLRYMVRMMTAALLEVGRGKLECEDIRKLLEAKSKTAARRNAHPEGLTLMQVDYFRILAEDESFVVREILQDDVLEESLKEKLPSASFVLADRHSQKIYGLYDENRKALFEKEKNLEDETIRTQLGDGVVIL